MDDFDKKEVAEYDSPSIPLIRIIAADETSWKSIESIPISYYSHNEIPGASTERLADSNFMLYDGTRVFIIVSECISPRLKGLIEDAKDRDILTIVLTSLSSDVQIKCDAMGVMPPSQFRQCVEAVLEEFLKDSYTCVDYKDIEMIFRNSGSFSFYEQTGDDPEQIMAALRQQMNLSGVTCYLIYAVCNPHYLENRYAMRQLSIFQDLFEEVEIDDGAWSVRHDERLDPRTIRFSVFTLRKKVEKDSDHKPSFMFLLRKKLAERFLRF